MLDDSMGPDWNPASSSYRESLDAERRIYADCADVHRLPDIFHYWSNRHIRPMLREHGFDSVSSVFLTTLAGHCRSAAPYSQIHFASLGAGNCDFEISLAEFLVTAGFTGFVIDCIDLNRAMLDRGRCAAQQAGLSAHFSFVEADLNAWQPSHKYRSVLANQSLHHIVNLEGLFASIRGSLEEGGSFIVSDMIGRNGHLRWPEAARILASIWRQLPASYRVNRRFGLFQAEFEDWDCSGEGFEGVRAQDILPLLAQHFEFSFFFPYGNLVDVFVDRAFGPNFDPDSESDCAFIDRIHNLDEEHFASGRLAPTHLIAILSNAAASNPICRNGLSPAHCIAASKSPQPASAACDVVPSPREAGAERELAVFTARMTEARETIRARMDWALMKEAELMEASEWAARLDAQLTLSESERLLLQEELESRTRWAGQLSADAERTSREVARLQLEFGERTRWALAMQAELAGAAATVEALTARGEEQEATIRAQAAELASRNRLSRYVYRLAVRTWKALRV